MKNPPIGETLCPTTSFPDCCFIIRLILSLEYRLIAINITYYLAIFGP